MSNKIPGRYGTLKLSLTGQNGTYNVMAGVMDITLNMNGGEIKSTTHDDGVFETYLSGRSDFSLDISGLYDTTSAEQAAIINTRFVNNPSPIWAQYMPQDGSGKVLQAQVSVTKCNIGSPNDEATKFDFTLRLTGQPTWVNQ